LYRIEEISDNRVNLLNSIGFVWNKLDDRWDEMFQRLVTYKNQHDGSTLVPSDTQLGTWASHQRFYYINNNNNNCSKTLSVDRIKRLESIGFVWDVLEVQWMEMYNRLVAYKKQHRSTRVPRTYREDNDVRLGAWIRTQRNVNNKGKLLKQRLDLLNSVDFAWVGGR
jgi:hypothetical protein